MQIEDIWVSQRKLRNIAQVAAMIETIEDQGYLPPVQIAHDENGDYQLEDGHHRLTAYWLSGRVELLRGEFILLEKDRWRPRFGKLVDLLARCEI